MYREPFFDMFFSRPLKTEYNRRECRLGMSCGFIYYLKSWKSFIFQQKKSKLAVWFQFLFILPVCLKRVIDSKRIRFSDSFSGL